MSYITTADLEELGYKWDDSIIANLENMCITSSAMVDAYIQRVMPGGSSLEYSSHTETLKCLVKNGKMKIFPRFYLIDSVESIVITVNEVTDTTQSLNNFRVQNDTQVIICNPVGLGDGEYYVTISYHAGFKPTDLGVSTIPIDVKKATILIAQSLLSEYFLVKNFNISQLTMFKQGNLSFQRSSKLLEIPINSTSALLLAEYRRVR